MGTEPQNSAVNKKLATTVAVVLALLMIAICYLVFLIIRNILVEPPAQPQVAQPEFPLPSPEPSITPDLSVIPAVVDTATPTILPTPIPTVWRFVSINKEDVGTFENINNPNQKLVAKCKDPKRPIPKRGALYTLDDSGVLRLQDGSKKYQRFEFIGWK